MRFKSVLLTFFIASFFSTVLNAQQKLDTLLIKRLEELIIVDQLAAANAQPPKEFESMSQTMWEEKKDSIYRANKKEAEIILDSIGFPGFDRVGKRGSTIYFLLVQHADFDPIFQKRVLDSMLPQVKRGNAKSRNYGFLTDRIAINNGKPQIYGTQLDYTFFRGKAISLETMDPVNINKRRKEIGLEPIEEYLASETQFHRQTNPMILGYTVSGFVVIVLSFVLLFGVWIVVRKKKKS